MIIICTQIRNEGRLIPHLSTYYDHVYIGLVRRNTWLCSWSNRLIRAGIYIYIYIHIYTYLDTSTCTYIL